MQRVLAGFLLCPLSSGIYAWRSAPAVAPTHVPSPHGRRGAASLPKSDGDCVTYDDSSQASLRRRPLGL